MIEIASFLLIAIFVPVIVFAGLKIYNTTDKSKFYNIFTLVLLGLELLRFFYNATFYDKATTPANEMKLTYLTFITVIASFAAFNKNKIGVYSKKILIITSLFPIIIGLFYKQVYTSELDTHSVLNALYYVECGMVITLALSYAIDQKQNFNLSSILIAACWSIIYIGINGLYAHLWKTIVPFDLTWILAMSSLLVSGAVVILINFILNKVANK